MSVLIFCDKVFGELCNVPYEAAIYGFWFYEKGCIRLLYGPF